MNIADIREKYPQYSDLSDTALAAALHKKFYADMPAGEFAQKIGLQGVMAKEPEGPSFLNQLGRQAGLAGRYVAEGAMALPNMVGDAVNSGINMMGGNLGMPSQAFPKALTELGLPEPQQGLEQALAPFAKALTGVGGMAQLAKAAPALAPLGQNMLAQGQAALGGAGAGEAAKGAGAGELGQMGASLAGGLMTPMALAGAGRAMTGARELARPLTQTGQQQIVGTAMNRMAADPRQALQNLQNPEMYVAGSVPTTAQASNDLGLLSAERSVARQPQNVPSFLAQQEANNAARLAELRSIAGPEDAIELAKAQRDAKALPILERAFAKAKPVDVAPIERLIGSIATRSKNPSLDTALATLQRKIAGETDAEQVYEVRKLVDLFLDKSIPEHLALAKSAPKSLMAVKNKIDDALNIATKNQFQKYLETYSDMSKYVDRARAGQQIVGRFDNAQVDTQGNPNVTPYALKSELKRVKNPVTKGGPETIFNTGEMDALNRVVSDLDRASLSNVRAGAGSDTFQNLATGNFVGRTLGEGQRGSTIMQTALRRPLDFLYKPAEQKMQGLLGDAMLDPKLGRQMMEQRMNSPVPAMTIKELMERGLYGGLLGYGANQ